VNEPPETAQTPEEQTTEKIRQFLRAIFDEHETILFRPIITWTENGKKRSQVIYKSILYRACHPVLMLSAIPALLKAAEQHQANLFFGVCPRVGPNGRFDLAWQIRTVRVLWADIDHVSVEEALARVRAAGLPEPSIVVNSGNGVHLYWILETPYLIDDAGPLIAVETEWTTSADGRRKPRKYIVEDGERVYLDERRHVKRLSPNATQAQDILAGIASAIGGDHTTDLARLLRLPYTLNRKDQRNGKEPKPTEIAVFEPTRRYPISEFERFAKPSEEAKREEQIAKMPLPQVRRPSASKSDKLAALVAASAIAPAGSRSEADFAVCCYAIRNGISKEEVWPQVEGAGKFAERGREYFERTWENAEYDVRATKFEEIRSSSTKSRPVSISPGVTEADAEGGLQGGGAPEFCDIPDEGDDANTIVFDSAKMRVAWLMQQVTDRLIAAGTYFNRADQPVAVSGERITAILHSAELAGLLNQHVEFYYFGDEEGQFKPLLPAHGNTWLNHPAERSRLPEIKLFSRNPVYSLDWRLTPSGYDAESGIYYAGPPVEARPDTKHLDCLLREFCFKVAADRTNFIGILLTCLLTPHFVGCRPGLLLNGNQPGLGKTILAQLLAILRDGQPVQTLTYNPNDEEFEKHLGAAVRNGLQTLIIDNAKAKPGKQPAIDSACLERSITDRVLSYRLLGSSSCIRAENSHQFVITANTPNVSRDLVTRCVVINLYHEGDPTRRSFQLCDPEAYAAEHRPEILGELIGMVERWKAAGMPKANVQTRFNKQGWGAIVGGILNVNGEPDFLVDSGDASEELDETRRDFSELVRCMHSEGLRPRTAGELERLASRNRLLAEELGDGVPRSRSTRMGHLCGRYVGERFVISENLSVTFHKGTASDGHVYSLKSVT